MSASSALDESVSIHKESVNDSTKKVAPPETPYEIRTRRVILAAFWAVVILLGVPHWLWTTSVYRAELDVTAASRWVNGEACKFQYLINVAATSDFDEPDNDFAYSFPDFAAPNESTRPESGRVYKVTALGASQSSADFTAHLRSVYGPPATTYSVHDSEVTVECSSISRKDCAHKAQSAIEELTRDEQSAVAHILRHSSFSEQFAGRTHADASEAEKRSMRAFKYASSYHLTFSLFVASSTPSAWDIELALQQYIEPLLYSLSGISKFTVDTQVQLFSSFSPSMAGPHYDEQNQRWTLEQADLSGFINAAEWPLNPSIDAGPTINFVLYIPPVAKTPLLVTDSTTNSWIIPQWGGVQILNRASSQAEDVLDINELESAMYIFADQLTSLVGLPEVPASLQLRIKALTRERIASLIVSASSTLGALIRLTEKLEQIAIPQSVAQAVSDSVANLELACTKLESGKYQDALKHARQADEAVAKAFFEPSMVGQVYFPDEHKVAVYVPLLGPMAVPLVLATIKEIKSFRQRKVKTN